MNCHAAQNQLAAYLSSQLSGDENRALAEHLAGCANCRARLASLMQVENHVRVSMQHQFERLAPPAGAWARLEAETLGRPSKPIVARASRRLMALCVLTAVVIVGLLAPSLFAQVAEAVGHWFDIQVPNSTTQVRVGDFQAFTPFAPAYLPPGFDLTTTGVRTAPGQDEFRLVYQHASETILLLQRKPDVPLSSLTGKIVVLDRTSAVLVDDLSAVSPTDMALFKSASPNRLAWDEAGVRLELLANLPTADLARIANSMRPSSP
jgi:hypothetical protein